MQSFGEDDYLLIDCPGQIELFTHIPVLRTFVDYLKNDGWNVCAIFCLDSHFVTDSAKFIAGCFQALAAMVTLEVAHINVLTKVDLLENKVRCMLISTYCVRRFLRACAQRVTV
jgi:GPN-loop GTPase